MAPAVPGGSAVYIAAYDPQGTVQWANSVSSAALPAQLTTHGMAVDTAGTVYVGGLFSSVIDFGTTSLSVTGPAPRTDLFLARYDRQGRFVAAQRDGGPDADDNCTAMALEPGSGKVYLASISSIFPTNGPTSFGGNMFTMGGITDAFVVALDNRTPLSSHSATTLQLLVSPVPSLAGTSLQVSLPASCTELQLLDNLGRVVRRQAVGAQARHVSIPLAGLSPGIYLLQAPTSSYLLKQRIMIE